MHLQDPSLLRHRALIEGVWTAAADGATTRVLNPATGALVGEVPLMGARETHRAVEAAATALPAWRARTASDRAAVLRRWNDLILLHREDLAVIMTSEQGKPLREATGEIAYAASFVEWFAEEGKRAYGDVIPANSADCRVLVLRQPVGVVAAITPWNFPSAMITRKVAPALAAGCTVVVKPAPQTPFSALALAALGERAGIPAGVLNVVTGDAESIGGEMTANPLVRKLSFTGSTRVGKQLIGQCADTVKRVSLELGGHAPFIVFDDADLERAVQGALASKYRCSGQTCVCANRIYVQAGLHDDFVARFAAASAELAVGNGMDDVTDLGPMINEAAVKKVEHHIQDAAARGARVVTGGRRHALGGTFFEPTVLTEVTPDMLVMQEETFGPVSPISVFRDEAEVVALANATEYGLAAYFYSRDLGRVWRVAEALEYGMVGINTGILSAENVPFGGIKQSGVGREGSRYGIDEYLELKYLCLSGIRA
jgi:succinate-semialdehyde dehydrogenase/glutarate-semialdehyde dehydrogenase